MNIYLASDSPDYTSLPHLLRWRAQHTPDQVAYTFLSAGCEKEAGLTYKQLDKMARAIGGHLQEMGLEGERALLLYPPGLEYIAAFLGCLYAGVVAVPAYPLRSHWFMDRLLNILEDAQVMVALTTTQDLSHLRSKFFHNPALSGLRWLLTDQFSTGCEEAWREPSLDNSTIAFLQYTSGSTGAPKGVVLTHKNLLHNLSLIQNAFSTTSDSSGVIWLPPYHDMGLIGGILQPLYGGFPVTLMSPFTFLQRPLSWLQTIAHKGVTISGGPNFAYDLCVQRIPVEEREHLDLRCWELAFIGAEPVRQDTLRRFEESFGPYGFRREAFYPCYGLAEATLFVSGGPKTSFPVILPLQKEAFAQNQIISSEVENDNLQTLVSCGRPAQTLHLMIVDPENRSVCHPGHVGEIWLAGHSVARGYWERPEETSQTFYGYLANTGEGPFLRTGDLGFLHNDELFITGRLKDLIIIRGKNHYPQDIEQTVERCHSALQAHCGAAVSITSVGEERLVIIQEVRRQHQHLDLDEVIEAIRRVVAEQHELSVYAVVLLKPAAIPKTSSGKIQRSACRILYQKGELASLKVWQADISSLQQEHISGTGEVQDQPRSLVHLADIETWLTTQISRLLDIVPQDIDIDKAITSYGLDSVKAIEILHRIETGTGVSLPLAALLQGSSIASLAQKLLFAQTDFDLSESPGSILDEKAPTPSSFPLSYRQKEQWFMQERAPESDLNVLAFAARVPISLDRLALKHAFQSLVDRHAALRTTFKVIDSETTQNVHDSLEVPFNEVDASKWGEKELKERLKSEARRQFDPLHGPLFQVCLFTRSLEEHTLLIVVHHLISDFWSLVELMQELGALYHAAKNNIACDLPPLLYHYSDYVKWEREMLVSPEGEQHWAYWRQHLDGELPVLDLATDRTRPEIQTFCSASIPFSLTSDLSKKIETLAYLHETTVFVYLLATFYWLLYRYSNQRDIIVGFPVANRENAAFAHLIGSIAKPAIVRHALSGDPSFEQFLAQMQERVLETLQHKDYPLFLLVKHLNSGRDFSRSPLFQAMFNFINIRGVGHSNLAAFALGVGEARLNLGELVLESMVLERHADQFDLTVTMGEIDGKLQGSFDYNADLFNDTTIQAMSQHFVALLEDIATQPHLSFSQLCRKIPGQKLSIAVTSTFTAEPIRDSLTFWLQKMAIPMDLQFAPYNQIFQQLLDADSLVATNDGGINIILLRLEDWCGKSLTSIEEVSQAITQNQQAFLSALKLAVTRTNTTFFVGLLPVSDAVSSQTHLDEIFRGALHTLEEESKNMKSVHWLDLSQAAINYEIERIHDTYTDRLGQIPFTPEFFAAAGTIFARNIHALYNNRYKVLVVDCDQVLWKGVCGEDGAMGIEIDRPYQMLQSCIVAQQEAGMLLCLCSKNNEKDVLEVFQLHPDMPLKLHLFISRRINWLSKAENIRSLAEELQLSLDSFIFLDDNAVECAEVRATFPQVLTLQLPSDSRMIPSFLEHVWAFDHLQITTEDRMRTEQYQQNNLRKEFAKCAVDIETFIDSLNLVITATSITPNQLERVAQLTQRTNQFNTSAARYSTSEIQYLLTGKERECLVVEVSDRFGDYGLVGVILFALKGEVLVVDTFLLSCRVLGKNVEDTVLAQLALIGREKNCSRLRILFHRTSKNQPALDFLLQVTPEEMNVINGYHCFDMSIELLLHPSNATKTPFGFRFKRKKDRLIEENTERTEVPPDQIIKLPPDVSSQFRILKGLREASEVLTETTLRLQTADQILHAMQTIKKARPEIQEPFVTPHTPLEENLLLIWKDVLRLDRMGIHDNFFDLGGDSLLAVQILSRVRELHNVEISLADLFNAEMTVAGLARVVEQHLIMQTDNQKLIEMLAYLDELSDEEVQALIIKGGLLPHE